MTNPQLPPVAEAAHLTAALRKAGALDRGAVREVAVLSSRDTILSHIVRLGLRYVGESDGAPQSLILKIAQATFAKTLPNAGRHEVAFYTKLAPNMPERLVPRCFDGHFNEESLAWHLLLEDLSDSHYIATTWPLPPSTEQAISIVRALGAMHAAWWDDARLGNTIGIWADRDQTTRDMETFSEHFARFADYLGDRLDADRRETYDRLIEQSTKLSERYHSRRHISIGHGDAHTWNFMLPRDPAADTVRLFDFDLWRIGVPTSDLAYMIAMHWHPGRRRALEQPLLDVYHETLLSQGVRGYDRDALEQDYRWSVLWHITKPVWQWVAGIPPVIWWNNCERIFLAVDDLGCEEFLE